MTRPTCPHCGATPFAAFFKPRFNCTACHTHLSSNLRLVSLVECLVGIGPVLLMAAALLKSDALKGWTFAQVLLILFIPACIVHLVVLCRYLRLVKRA